MKLACIHRQVHSYSVKQCEKIDMNIERSYPPYLQVLIHDFSDSEVVCGRETSSSLVTSFLSC